MYAIVIGASDEAVYAIEQAKRMGLRVMAFDGNSNAGGLSYADEAYIVDIRKPENIYAILDEKGISAKEMCTLPVPIGRYLISSGAVNEHYHLIGPKRKTTEICTDKWLFHQTLQKEGLRNISCRLIVQGEKAERPERFPVIVKPRYGAGSRQVLRISDEEEWDVFEKDMPLEEDFIVEDSVEGQEYGIDGMVVHGIFHLILARKKLITPPPYRQCVGYLSTGPGKYAEKLEEFTEFMSKLVRSVGLEDGILHADIIEGEAGLFVIEMSARPSGHRLHDLFTPLVTGIDMVSEFIHYAETGEFRVVPCVRDEVYMIRYFDMESEIKRVPEQEVLLEKYPIIKYECHLNPGEVEKIKDGHSLMGRGFFILRGSSEEEVCDTANQIIKEFL